ncbi:MAG: YtxH domain-containing protein [Syntrophales bacterium]|jgi:gas vesicle protein|nr:YtxH domain-containing protein [Syntrophales bacterium]MDY0043669.1 YtxH domain-containing protein [Syntrophales bacterium]
MNEKDESNERFKYFIIGGLIAASAALLFAPKSGRETRGYLADKAKEGKDFIYKEAQEAGVKIIDGREKIRLEAMEILKRAKDISQKEKDTILDALRSR